MIGEVLVGCDFLVEELIVLKVLLAEVVLDLFDKVRISHCCICFIINRINNHMRLVNC